MPELTEEQTKAAAIRARLADQAISVQESGYRLLRLGPHHRKVARALLQQAALLAKAARALPGAAWNGMDAASQDLAVFFPKPTKGDDKHNDKFSEEATELNSA